MKDDLKEEQLPNSYVHVRTPWEGSNMGSEGWSWAVGGGKSSNKATVGISCHQRSYSHGYAQGGSTWGRGV